MKIGIYADKYQPGTWGGIDQFFIASTRALVKYLPEHDYTILAQAQNAAILREEFANEPIKIHSLNPQNITAKAIRFLGRKIPFIRTDERSQIKRLNFDILSFPRQLVHIYGLNCPRILSLFDIQHEYMPTFFTEEILSKRRKQYSQSISEASCILVAADFTIASIAKIFPEHRHKLKRIYPGINIPESVSQEAIQAFKQKYRLPDAFLYYPANAWPHKNHARLFHALGRLRQQNNLEIPLVLTGRLQGSSADTIQKLAIAEGIEDLVYDLGFVTNEEMRGLYTSARGLIFPSLFEGFGFPVLEAQATDCPVLCADATTLPEITGDSALLFDPMDAQSIAQSIQQFWQDAALREALKEKGRQNLKRFTWEKYAQEINVVFKTYHS